MTQYIDGFIFPIPKKHLEEYKTVAEQVADIWREYGALAYNEYVCDDLKLEGTRSFADAAEVQEDEVVVFGWVLFPSKDVRDAANQQVPKDPRMAVIVEPLTRPDRLIFNAGRMVYGGFKPIIQSD